MDDDNNINDNTNGVHNNGLEDPGNNCYESFSSFQEGVTECMISCEETRHSIKTKQQQAGLINNGITRLASNVLLDEIWMYRENIDEMFHRLQMLQGYVVSQNNNNKVNNNGIEKDMFAQCEQRVYGVVQMVFSHVLSLREKEEEKQLVVDGFGEEGEQQQQEKAEAKQQQQEQLELERRDCQASIARILELNFIMHINITANNNSPNTNNTNTARDIIDKYVSYQRQVFRERCKPGIAQLAQERRQAQQLEQQQFAATNTSTIQQLMLQQQLQEQKTLTQNIHSQVITMILGQASALIHPLLTWKQALPPPPPPDGNNIEDNSVISCIRKLCQESIQVLDEQAQTLTKTISDWFWKDRKVDEYWMTRSTAPDSTTDNTEDCNLAELDALLEEMAFICQLLARYETLLQDEQQQQQQNTSSASKTTTMMLSNELLPEYTWKYASLERFLATRQWKSAYQMASPVHIVLGTSIQVPSVVEDAQYLSTRALERSVSTRSTQAIGTVAHSLSNDIWGTELHSSGNNSYSGVHQALVDQRGCWTAVNTDNDNEDKKNNKQQGNNTFASALLDALEDDVHSNDNTAVASPPRSKPPSAPSSGNFFFSSLSAVVEKAGGKNPINSIIQDSGSSKEKSQEVRIDTQLCSLNGIHSASIACRSLVQFLDDLLQEYDDNNNDDTNDNSDRKNNKATTISSSMSMIQLAREDFSRYSKEYETLLQNQISDIIHEWCGSVDDVLEDFERSAIEIAWMKQQQQQKNKEKKLPHHILPFRMLKYHLQEEDYQLDLKTMNAAEKDKRLQELYIHPLQECLLLQQIGKKCDGEVLAILCQQLVMKLVRLVLDCSIGVPSLLSLVSNNKRSNQNNNNDVDNNHNNQESLSTTQPHDENHPQQSQENSNDNPGNNSNSRRLFTDWGCLLLSKQVRMLQAFISNVIESGTYYDDNNNDNNTNDTNNGAANNNSSAHKTKVMVYQSWDILAQILTVLQLEKPSDWSTYYQSSSKSKSSQLSRHELYTIMSLRVDFSTEAIQAAVGK